MPEKKKWVGTFFPNDLTEEELVEQIIAFLREEGVEVLDDEEGGETEE